MQNIFLKSFVFISLFLMMLLVSIDTTIVMFHKWNLMSENQGHAWLLLAMFFYLVYENQHKFELAETILTVPLVIAALALLFNVVASIFDILLFNQFAMLGFVYFAIKAVFNTKDELQVLRLVSLLIFTTTAFDHLTPALVMTATFVVEHLISGYGLTAYIDGPLIQIPSGLILIADSCSGVRYVIVAMAMAWIMGIMENATIASNVKLLVYSILIALVANWIRIFLLVVIGNETEMQSSLMKDHELFGFVVFFVCFGPLFKYRLISREKNTDSQSTDTLTAKVQPIKVFRNLAVLAGLLGINIALLGIIV